jgi:hypothetical protein
MPLQLPFYGASLGSNTEGTKQKMQQTCPSPKTPSLSSSSQDIIVGFDFLLVARTEAKATTVAAKAIFAWLSNGFETSDSACLNTKDKTQQSYTLCTFSWAFGRHEVRTKQRPW